MSRRALPQDLDGLFVALDDTLRVHQRGVQEIGRTRIYAPTFALSGTSQVGVAGTPSGVYADVGDVTHYAMRVVFVGAFAGTGIIEVGLPSAVAVGLTGPGVGWFNDASTGLLVPRPAVVGSGTLAVFLDGAGAYQTQAVPWTWAAADILTLAGSYLRQV